MKTLCLFTLILALYISNATNLPVIGVLSIPSSVKDHPPGNYSYIPASYIKFIESAGARVIPIPYDASPENITFLLEQVNGVFFIGGGADLTHKDHETGKIGPSNLTKAGLLIVEHVLNANKKGENFPLMAVCLGWEMLLMTISGRYENILYTGFKDFNVKAGVKFVHDPQTSKIWSRMASHLRDYIQEKPGLLYDHRAGILPDRFQSIRALNEVLKITSVSDPVNGGPTFVASAEGRKYPIFGSQFHPEKTSFEWKPQVDPPHSPESVELCQSYARTLVYEARKNNRTFKSADILSQSVIYNWSPSTVSETFSQVYTFSTVLQAQSEWPALFKSTTPAETTSADLPSFKAPKVQVHVEGPANTMSPVDIKMLRGANI